MLQTVIWVISTHIFSTDSFGPVLVQTKVLGNGFSTSVFSPGWDIGHPWLFKLFFVMRFFKVKTKSKYISYMIKYIWRYLESQAIVKKWQGRVLMVEGECAILVFQHRQRQLRDLFRRCHDLYIRLWNAWGTLLAFVPRFFPHPFPCRGQAIWCQVELGQLCRHLPWEPSWCLVEITLGCQI